MEREKVREVRKKIVIKKRRERWKKPKEKTYRKKKKNADTLEMGFTMNVA